MVKPIRSSSYSVQCELCSVGPSLCIPFLLNGDPQTILERKRSFAKNEILAHEKAPFEKFYIVHAGAVKTYITTKDGTEQINGFYVPGDIVGLDCISTHKYNNTIKALTNTLACELKYDELMDLIGRNERVRDMILNLMSSDIHNCQNLILHQSQKKAEEKLAMFIYTLYTRYALRGHTSLNIKLSMNRADIANYLGLTIETISRLLTRLQELKILEVKGRYLHIQNLPMLINLAN